MTNPIDQLHAINDSGVSWYKIAKDLETSFQTISNWKSGKIFPSPVYQRLITKYYKKTFDITAKI